jgi:hypothetical protein
MDGFVDVFRCLLIENRVPAASFAIERSLVVPGAFTVTHRWDLAIVQEGAVLAAVDFETPRGAKGLADYANRAVGVAEDVCAAYRMGNFGRAWRPWLGALVLAEDTQEARRPSKAPRAPFRVDGDLRRASHLGRIELFLRRVLMARIYDSCALIASRPAEGPQGQYSEPASDLSVRRFLADLVGRASALHVAGAARGA